MPPFFPSVVRVLSCPVLSRAPCAFCFQIEITAPEKKEKGKGKKNRGGTRAEDFSRGGIDGGLRHLLVLPYPVASGSLTITHKNKENGLCLEVELLSVREAVSLLGFRASKLEYNQSRPAK